jgi:multidrug resistance efflux pump
VDARGSLEAARASDLYCPLEVASTILQIVPEGRRVQQGDLVCELDSAALRDQLTNQKIAQERAKSAYLNAKLSREVAEIAVVEYAEGIFKQELYTLKSQIAGSEASIQKAEDRLERTRRARQRMSEVAQGAAKTPADIAAEVDIADRLEDAEQRLVDERKALELGRAKLDTLEKYTREKTTKALKVEAERKRSEELVKQEAWLLEKNKVDKLAKQIDACRIKAPRAGVISYAKRSGPQIEEGATVRQRQKIVTVVDLDGPMQVNVKVPEDKIDLVSPGLRASVTIDAFPLTTMPAIVDTVAPLPDPVAMATWDSKVYTTRLRLLGPLPGLRPGMTARAEISADKVPNLKPDEN